MPCRAAHAGGKTASLKTLGLMALMAKAGLFLSVQPWVPDGSSSNTHSGSNGCHSGAAPPEEHGTAAIMQQPQVAWFGSVLADLGDSQDLQQSLSTFSGHVRRLGRILAAADEQCLVLLDEVGSAACMAN